MSLILPSKASRLISVEQHYIFFKENLYLKI